MLIQSLGSSMVKVGNLPLLVLILRPRLLPSSFVLQANHSNIWRPISQSIVPLLSTPSIPLAMIRPNFSIREEVSITLLDVFLVDSCFFKSFNSLHCLFDPRFRGECGSPIQRCHVYHFGSEHVQQLLASCCQVSEKNHSETSFYFGHKSTST